MFTKILVALDRSEMGQEIFRQALSLAKITSSQLMLLHVLSTEEEGSPYMPVLSTLDYYPGMKGQTFQLYEKQWDTFKTAGIEMLQSLCAQANAADITCEFTQNIGSPGKVICEFARSWNANLIIMGRRGHSGLTEIFLGSVSNYVLHHAPCSMHVVHFPVKSQDAEVAAEITNAI